jgi:hypothetical protein
MGGGGSSQTVGYRYSMGLHLVLCHGPVDVVQEIRIGERTAWGHADQGPLPVGHGLSQINIDHPELFGGDEREGGVVGAVDVLPGQPTQTPNDYLQSQLGVLIPAFRGVLSLVARRIRFAANNPYLKPWAVRVRRFTQGWGTTNWMAASAEVQVWDEERGTTVTVGMNPAHILAECLTNPHWGMGYPDSSIGATFWNANWLFNNEGFGLNLLWTRQQPIETFISQVLDHVGAVLYTDPQSGLFEIKMIRGDYWVPSLPQLGPDEIVSLDRFERAQWGELPNEITVVYTDWDTGGERTVSAENLAAIHVQGGVINQRRDYAGVSYAPLAARLAMRDLRALGTPLARMSLRVSRSTLATQPLPGDVFSLYWPRLGIAQMVVRVVSVDAGTQSAPELLIEAVEDVFGLEATAVRDEPKSWQAPVTQPTAPDLALAFELPFWEIARRLSRADMAYVNDTDTWIGVLAVNAGNAQLNWRLMTGMAAGNLQSRATGDYAGMVTLTDSLPMTEAHAIGVHFDAAIQVDRMQVGDYGYLVDASHQIREAVEILAIDPFAATVNLARGILDTTPQTHAPGTRLVVVGDWTAGEGVDRAPGESVFVSVIPKTTFQQGAEHPADNGSPMVLGGRQGLPYPPGRVRINGLDSPAVAAGDLVITWAHRDRTQQTAYLVHQDASNIGPELGTTYVVFIRDALGILIHTSAAIAGTTYTWDIATAAAEGGILADTVTVEIQSVRDAWESWQKQRRTVERAGYGLRYGQYWGRV